MSTVTRREIKQIETLAGYGLTQEQIGDCLGWSKRTSQRKLAEIPEAVAAYKEGRSKAISAVSKTVYRKAIEGNVACAFFYLKTQAGWRETERHEVTGADGGPIAVEWDGARERLLHGTDRIATRLRTAGGAEGVSTNGPRRGGG